jgi:glucose-6-phosphate 1-dehydrogenase
MAVGGGKTVKDPATAARKGETCGAEAGSSEYDPRRYQPCIMVIFGASGDLTSRMLMPSLYSLEKDGLLHDRFAIVGFGRTQMDDGSFRQKMVEGVKAHTEPSEIVGATLDRFAARLHYVSGDYGDQAAFKGLKAAIMSLKGQCGAESVLYYVALPPTVCEQVLNTMKAVSFVPSEREGATERIMVEKPFGLDYESAVRLDKLLASIFEESEIYRVDHYLGKDTIRNLLLLRFANSIFEPLWDRRYVDNIQITGAESIGVEGRGGYYDEAGVVRDMVQNHILQVLSLIAMDPPVAGDAESVRDKKMEIIKSLGAIGENDFVVGQYKGYRGEKGVARDSNTPTFVALKLAVNNWRWYGVPFYVRAGKALARKFTEVTIVFKHIPLCVLDDQSLCDAIRPNVIYVRIQPDEGIRLSFSAKVPGRRDEVATAAMDFSYADFGRKIPDAYERVLLDGLCGVPTLFWRADAIERAWQVVGPLLEPTAAQVAEYEPGGWGPAEAEALIRRDGRNWISSYE